jgi:hypothetical protein
MNCKDQITQEIAWALKTIKKGNAEIVIQPMEFIDPRTGFVPREPFIIATMRRDETGVMTFQIGQLPILPADVINAAFSRAFRHIAIVAKLETLLGSPEVPEIVKQFLKGELGEEELGELVLEMARLSNELWGDRPVSASTETIDLRNRDTEADNVPRN